MFFLVKENGSFLKNRSKKTKWFVSEEPLLLFQRKETQRFCFKKTRLKNTFLGPEEKKKKRKEDQVLFQEKEETQTNN